MLIGLPFQSTLPARGATPAPLRICSALRISIHAPRTGSDTAKSTKRSSVCRISIHAPRTGSDKTKPPTERGNEIFQSTLPARGATSHRRVFLVYGCPFQSTLPARGATSATRREGAGVYFNPRSPHGERPHHARRIHHPRHFNPRSPHGERLNVPDEAIDAIVISIHAPRTGSDHVVAFKSEEKRDISIHAPRTGSDMMTDSPQHIEQDFNPRSPHGERPRCPSLRCAS